MIVDLNTNKVIYSNHPDLVRPIASISKLMTAMVCWMHDCRWMKTKSGYQPDAGDERGLFARTTE
ncbi:penicillin-binding protein 7 [Escherichia coli]|nr:penicillin-binding protein 7 [Escherichia coli]